jgi:Cu/Ag efflux protein CusF
MEDENTMKKQIVGLSFLAVFAMASAGFAWGTYQDPQSTTQQQAAKRATAKVVSVDASRNAIEIKDQAGSNVTMAVSPTAKITKDGKDVTLNDIKPDDTVSVEWEDEGGKMTAKSVTVVSGKGRKP